jgi:S1-C subfamily serine protease
MKAASSPRRRCVSVLALLALLAVSGCAGAAGTPAPQGTLAEAAPRPDLGVVALMARIGGERERSAGAVLDAEKGLILTTAHGVWGASSLQVTTGLAVLHGRIVARDACDDLALVETQPRVPGLVALPPARDDSLIASAPLVAVWRRDGAPGVGGPGLLPAPATFTPQRLQSLPGLRAAGALRLVVALTAGATGAPLVDAEGRLAGLATIVARGRETRATALPWSTIRSRLDELRPGASTIYIGWQRHYGCAGVLHRYTRARHPRFRTGDVRLNAPVPVTRLRGTKVDAG